MAHIRETFSRYDTAGYLTDEQRIAAFLEAAIKDADGDAASIAQAKATVERARANNARQRQS